MENRGKGSVRQRGRSFIVAPTGPSVAPGALVRSAERGRPRVTRLGRPGLAMPAQPPPPPRSGSGSVNQNSGVGVRSGVCGRGPTAIALARASAVAGRSALRGRRGAGVRVPCEAGRDSGARASRGEASGEGPGEGDRRRLNGLEGGRMSVHCGTRSERSARNCSSRWRMRSSSSERSARYASRMRSTSVMRRRASSYSRSKTFFARPAKTSSPAEASDFLSASPCGIASTSDISCRRRACTSARS